MKKVWERRFDAFPPTTPLIIVSIILFIGDSIQFFNQDFVIDQKCQMGLRSGEFPGQLNTFNLCFLKKVFHFLRRKARGKILLEYSSTIRKCSSRIWNYFFQFLQSICLKSPYPQLALVNLLQ